MKNSSRSQDIPTNPKHDWMRLNHLKLQDPCGMQIREFRKNAKRLVMTPKGKNFPPLYHIFWENTVNLYVHSKRRMGSFESSALMMDSRGPKSDLEEVDILKSSV